ncbi:hypothetical protein B0H16DRAFT_476401 [Mycena metata]|uniref:Uncharacterized protein n=1 Tax=Mycena metata TaxID=1033252 RepID=A0AAD7KEM4_9AGAR|nr:hypothetical protein B0H16DRAFT_476401 [Mycena metata]
MPAAVPPSSPQNEEDVARAHQWSDDEAQHLDPSNKGKGKSREAEQPEYAPVTDEDADTRRREEDLAGAHQWSDDEAEHLDPSNKGKGKARKAYPDEEDASSSSEQQEYPPVTDDEAETRRIEENLRRWEGSGAHETKGGSGIFAGGWPATYGPLQRMARKLTLEESLRTRTILIRASVHTLRSTPKTRSMSSRSTRSPPRPRPLQPIRNTRTRSRTQAAADPFSDAEAIMSPSCRAAFPDAATREGFNSFATAATSIVDRVVVVPSSAHTKAARAPSATCAAAALAAGHAASCTGSDSRRRGKDAVVA